MYIFICLYYLCNFLISWVLRAFWLNCLAGNVANTIFKISFSCFTKLFEQLQIHKVHRDSGDNSQTGENTSISLHWHLWVQVCKLLWRSVDWHSPPQNVITKIWVWILEGWRASIKAESLQKFGCLYHAGFILLAGDHIEQIHLKKRVARSPGERHCCYTLVRLPVLRSCWCLSN